LGRAGSYDQSAWFTPVRLGLGLSSLVGFLCISWLLAEEGLDTSLIPCCRLAVVTQVRLGLGLSSLVGLLHFSWLHSVRLVLTVVINLEGCPRPSLLVGEHELVPVAG